jgi:hypothetical protein
MSQITNQDAVVFARDNQFGDDDEQERTGPAQPVGQDEVDELLYNSGIDAGDRLMRLRQLREQMAAADGVDVADHDARGVLNEIDRAIGELEGMSGEGMDPASVDQNPEDHRETLSPDDDDLLDALKEDEEDEADLFGEDDVLDPEEWDKDEDGFDSERGVK